VSARLRLFAKLPWLTSGKLDKVTLRSMAGEAVEGGNNAG